ncbi:MAG: NarK family nitrate/nitrite MFS transporter [Deltaproteobacteria bacterium]|nr:NarK family nitrate/nitrite MFS transporter [Deltaproteobacteria bacterium]
MAWINDWNPEDNSYWQNKGAKIARRNLILSIFALLLAFVVWMVWSTVVVELPHVGFRFSTNELFWLAALPGLSGATLRIFYAFMVPIFGGRNWTVVTTASLIFPLVGIGLAVQDTQTPYWVFLMLALLCGLGGGNFASSMSNISFFYPRTKKGTALGLNGGLGNLGVSVVQFLAPVVLLMDFSNMTGVPLGEAQVWSKGDITKLIWLQNVAWFWIPIIILATALAAWGMNNLTTATASFKDQAVIFRRKHNWLTGCLYTGTFGSFIGYSAALPLLIKTQFPQLNPLQYAFIGPLVGALARPLGGMLADRYGGARITLVGFVLMTVAAMGVLFFMYPVPGQGQSFLGFMVCFVALFTMSGIGNGSTYRMVPVIFQQEKERIAQGQLAQGQPDSVRARLLQEASKESAAVLGFISAIAAYGAFIVPKSFGYSVAKTGDVRAAFYGFMLYYTLCVGITWWYYARNNAEHSC